MIVFSDIRNALSREKIRFMLESDEVVMDAGRLSSTRRGGPLGFGAGGAGGWGGLGCGGGNAGEDPGRKTCNSPTAPARESQSRERSPEPEVWSEDVERDNGGIACLKNSEAAECAAESVGN